MKVRVTPKTAGNSVNVRRGMKFDENGVPATKAIDTLKDGAVVEAERTKNDDWYKVAKGYILSSLCEVVEEDEPAEEEVEE